MNNAMVAHNWANKTGTVSTGSHLYHNGDFIYSYSLRIAGHFGDKVVIMNLGSKGSQSTAVHIGYVESANHKPVISAYVIPETKTDNERHQRNVDLFVQDIIYNAKKIDTARKKSIYISAVNELQEHLHAYCAFFGYKMKKRDAAYLQDNVIDNFEVLKKKSEQSILREKARAKKKRIEQYNKQIIEFLQFKRDYVSAVDNTYTAIRYNADNNRFETSLLVQIPLRHAKSIYKWMSGKKRPCTDCNKEFMGYAVKELTETYITIGCHQVLRSEIEKYKHILEG